MAAILTPAPLAESSATRDLPAGTRDRAGWAAAAIAALAVMAMSLTFYPAEADAEYALFDPVWYASGAERGIRETILSHHLLFSVALVPLTAVLERFHFEHPGTLAARILSGAGGAFLVLLLAAIAGPRRRLAGVALALLVLATRGGWLETFAGENVLLAAGPAVLVLHLACGDAARLVPLGILLVFALLLRQDNVFIVPGLALALAATLPRPRRLRRIAVFLAVTGGATLALYAFAWLRLPHPPVHDVKSAYGGFVRFLTSVAEGWRYGPGLSGLEHDGARHLLQHFASAGFAVTGQQWIEPRDLARHVWVGAGFLAFVLVLGMLWRGTGRWRLFAGAALLTVLLRSAFFVLFEPGNFEWWLTPMVLVAAISARIVRGAPQSGRASRIGAGILALMGAAAILAAHLGASLELRERRLAAGARETVRNAPPGAIFFGFHDRAQFALQQAGPVGAGVVAGDLAWATREISEQLVREKLAAQREARPPRPLVVLVDIAVHDGHPAGMRALREIYPTYIVPQGPAFRCLHAGDRVIGLSVDPAAIPDR